MENLNKVCFMCGVSSCDGIILNGEKICKACEEKIVKTAVTDPDYEDYSRSIKTMLFNEHVDR